MNGRYTKPDQSVRQESNNAGAIGERFAPQSFNSMRSHSSYAEPAKAQEYSHPSFREGFGRRAKKEGDTQGLYNHNCDGDNPDLAVGQRASKIIDVAHQSYNDLKLIPIIRVLSAALTIAVVWSSVFHTAKWIFKEPPEDLITSAIASETVQSNKYSKTDKLGYFVEDCY